jgi:hypothetical protein
MVCSVRAVAKEVYNIKIMNCIYKVMGNTFRKTEPVVDPIEDVSQTIISFDMSGIEFVSTDEPHTDVSGAQDTMEPDTVVTLVDAPSLTVMLPEPRWLPEGDAHRSAIFYALISEIYGDASIDYESRLKYPEEVNICEYLCRRFLRLVNPNNSIEKTNDTNTACQNILDATNQTGKCKTV